MHPGALRALEFDRIVEGVCRYAQTPPGAARLARLTPQAEPRAVAAALAATAETTRFLAENPIALQAPWGLSPAILPELPLPTKIRTAFQDPVRFEVGPERADDDDYVDRKYREVRRSIQDGIDTLARRRAFPPVCR